jgi:hypothetical protein
MKRNKQLKMDQPLINRVANSSLKLINLETFYPSKEFQTFDLKPLLFKELILKEKDFRSSLKEIDWSQYKDKIVLVFNSNDAIIPVWAYMLISANLADHAAIVFQGTKEEYLKLHYQSIVDNLDINEYTDERVIIKGCSEKDVPVFAYAAITSKLKPVVQSLMFGEACSTVPVFKRPRKLPLKD